MKTRDVVDVKIGNVKGGVKKIRPKMEGISGSGMFKTCSHIFFTFTDSYQQYKNLNNFQRRMSAICIFGGFRYSEFQVRGI